MRFKPSIHLFGAALFFLMASSSHGQDALISLAKGAPDEPESEFNSPDQPTTPKVPFLSRWIRSNGSEAHTCQDGTASDVGLVSEVPT
ncbi:hypothetical protein OAK54_01535 [Akkermansiaceae bacterium]|nr:hypothetical protein [Akkermansiaceae bacterium]